MTKKPKIDARAERVVQDTSDARQGIELHSMRYLVTFGTIAAFVILGAIWLVYHAA